MKKLSIEQKAKAYDEAIKRENEKIRCFLINFVKINDGVNLPPDYAKKALSWLEKQGKCDIDCPQNHQDSSRPNGCIVLEDFNGGEGFYKLNLDYLNKRQVEEVEEMVRTWNKESNTSNENIKAAKTCKDEQKPVWSEEDDYLLNETIQHLKELIRIDKAKGCSVDVQYYQRDIDWLKSIRPYNRWISVDKEVYVKEPILAQMKDKSDPFDGFVVCCDHTLTPNVYERYMILGNIVSKNT